MGCDLKALNVRTHVRTYSTYERTYHCECSVCYTCQHLILLSADLSIDAMDVSGEQQFDVMHNIVKQRLSSDGSVVQEKELESKQSGCTYVRTYVCMLVCPSTYLSLCLLLTCVCVCVRARVSPVSKCVL